MKYKLKLLKMLLWGVMPFWFLILLFVGFSLSSIPAEAQLAKKGTAKGTSAWTSPGEIKEVGENHLYWVGVYWGMSFNDEGKGFLDDMAWYCPGVDDIINGIHRFNGYCTLTDMDGDKIYLSYRSLPYEGKGPIPTEGKYSGGTGKYTGIQGGYTFQCRVLGSQFICDFKANYQLP